MPCLSLAYWIEALLLAGLAVCWADVLVRPGMLLAPVQAWLRQRYFSFRVGWAQKHGPELVVPVLLELDAQWWWPPLWGCYKCVAGQWGFWGYLWLFRASSYSGLSHLGFTAATILLSLIVSKCSQE